MNRPTDSSASRGSLRDEAASWFAQMRGPDADEHRADFEAWLAQSPFHREAYNRIAETFSLGKMLKDNPPGHASQSRPAAPTKQKPRRAVFTTTIVGVLIAAGLGILWTRSSVPYPATQVAQRPQRAAASNPGGAERLATGVGEIRSFPLPDGSTATLDTDSLVLVSFDKGHRRLTLAKGRARFAVIHDGRPFLVAAGSGTVTAVGTLFDVGLRSNGRIDVRLLSGAIDVSIRRAAAATAQVRRLNAGEAITYGASIVPAVTSDANPADSKWPDGLRVFSSARLADVLEDANRYSAVRLRAAPDIADLKISGTYRIEDTRNLIDNAADVLGLSSISSPAEIILVRRCPPSNEINCRPPS